jgi:hypothetical protein
MEKRPSDRRLLARSEVPDKEIIGTPPRVPATASRSGTSDAPVGDVAPPGDGPGREDEQAPREPPAAVESSSEDSDDAGGEAAHPTAHTASSPHRDSARCPGTHSRPAPWSRWTPGGLRHEVAGDDVSPRAEIARGCAGGILGTHGLLGMVRVAQAIRSGPSRSRGLEDPASSPAATASALPRVCRGVPTACWADAQGQSRSCSESTSSLRWACWLSQARAPPPLVLSGHAASLTPY